MSLHTLYPKTSVGQLQARLGQGEEDMLPTSYLRQIDGWKNRQTDGQTDQYRAFAERGPN